MKRKNTNSIFIAFLGIMIAVSNFTPISAKAADDDRLAEITIGRDVGASDGITVEFNPEDAVSATLYYTTNNTDGASISFGSYIDELQEWHEMEAIVSIGEDGQCTAECSIPDVVGETVKITIYYPCGEDTAVEKVVLHGHKTAVSVSGDVNCDGAIGIADAVLL